MQGFKFLVGGVLLSSFVSSLLACSSSSNQIAQNFSRPQEKIINGELSDLQFAMKYGIVGVLDFISNEVCTGVVLSQDLVLTAAHCVTHPQAVVVVFDAEITTAKSFIEQGRADELKNSLRGVTQLEVHPNFFPSKQQIDKLILEKSRSHANRELSAEDKAEIQTAVLNLKDIGDLAILKLSDEKPTGYADSELARDLSDVADEAEVTLAGFGVSSARDNSSSGILHSVNGIKISELNFAKTEMLVDQREGKGSCRGDSGGPAFVRVMESGKTQTRLLGLTSRGYKDDKGDCSGFVVFTKISAHDEWIHATSAKLHANQ